MVHYGYRYYNPELGRWPSRDPIAEMGGLNLYGFVRNNPIGRIDPRGLTGANTCSVASQQLPGTISPDDVTNSAGFPELLYRDENFEVIITGPGDGSGEDSPITPPGGIPIGGGWYNVIDSSPNAALCKKRNKCKAICKNPCCEWEKEWEVDWLFGMIFSTNTDPTFPGGSYEGAYCDLDNDQMAIGLQKCKDSIPSCQ